jgi:phosphatidate cytidylyltransferase
MKKRITTAIVGLSVLALVLVFFDTILVSVLAAGITLLALLELFKAADLLRYWLLTAISGIFCLLIVFFNTPAVSHSFSYLCYLLVVALFLVLLRYHATLKVEQVSFAFLMSILLAVSFYCLIRMKELGGPQFGMFYLLLVFGSAWWSDSGAYFIGTFFGKHKLCPGISPKKTVEGLIGGIINAIVGNVLVCLVFQAFCQAAAPWGYIETAVSIDIPAVILISPVASLLGVLGDLSASVIKRQHGIKDFGHLMPGHGGAMDRFDSVLFVSPLFYIIFNIYPLISAI